MEARGTGVETNLGPLASLAFAFLVLEEVMRHAISD
jgi:hypothetical protein